MNNIIVQLIGFVGIALFLLSFQCKKNRSLFTVQSLAYLFYALHFILLGAVTGGINQIINILRCLCLASKFKWAHSWFMCGVFCAASLAVTIFTWNGWISLLPFGGTLAAVIGGYTENPRKIRIAGMFINSPLWIIYDIIVGSWAGIADEVFTESSIIISIIRFGWKNLDRVEGVGDEKDE